MGLNFPAAPIVGTLYPQPAIPGVAVYRYDGEKWSLQSLLAKQPIYDDGSVAMNAQLTLVAPPVAATDAAAKSYVDSRPPATGALRYDIAQGLTDPQAAQGRQNVYAAPFDAMEYNGIQINGACEVNQLSTGGSNLTLASGFNSFVIDGWRAVFAHVGATFTTSQYMTGGPPGIFSAVGMVCTAGAFSAYAPSDYVMFNSVIEGYRCRRLRWGTANAQPVTIGFWVYTTVAGTAALAVKNATNDRSYVQNFAVPAAGWTYVSLLVPGDIAGTWETANGVGMSVGVNFGVGTTFQGINGQWGAGNFLGTAQSSTGFFATAMNSVFVTGLTVHPGAEGPSAARSPYIQRPFDEEMRLAQRYYEKSYDIAALPGTVIGSGASLFYLAALPSSQFAFYLPFSFKVQKRANPTITFYSPSTGAAGKLRDGSAGADVTGTPANINVNGAVVNGQCFAATNALNFQWHFVADARL